MAEVEGRITQVLGAVVDVEFPGSQLPTYMTQFAFRARGKKT